MAKTGIFCYGMELFLWIWFLCSCHNFTNSPLGFWIVSETQAIFVVLTATQPCVLSVCRYQIYITWHTSVWSCVLILSKDKRNSWRPLEQTADSIFVFAELCPQASELTIEPCRFPNIWNLYCLDVIWLDVIWVFFWKFSSHTLKC